MSKNPVLYKSLVVGVIVLFIGVAISPPIYANELKEEELIEYTTTVCGLSGGKRTVYLKQEESQQVELLLDSIEEQLESVKSMEEAKKIYKKGVIELDKYGLLAGLSIEEAQKLVTRDFPSNIKQRISGKGDIIYENLFCMIAGTVYSNGSYSYCIPVGLSMIPALLAVDLMLTYGRGFFRDIFYSLIWLIYLVNPFKFFNIIVGISCDWDITTFGLRGLINSSEEYGELAIWGFTGLMISPLDKLYETSHFLGFCLAFDGF